MKQLTGMILIFFLNFRAKIICNPVLKNVKRRVIFIRKKKPDELRKCHVIKTSVFKLNFRDKTSILILFVGISASGIVVLVIVIVYAKRRKINRWISELIFLNFFFLINIFRSIFLY